jgi:dolichol-phosphate mannosyltransferase
VRTALTLDDSAWAVPSYQVHEIRPRESRYCLCIPVLNEGDRLRHQLESIQKLQTPIDVIIGDGGSTDGNGEPSRLRPFGVRTLLVKTGSGRLSAQLRMMLAYSLREGYEGCVTVDGNGKDGMEAIPRFVEALDQGCGFVQGSRYIPGGHHENTPLDRAFGLRLIHAPLISYAAGFRYTDTTNGFRAFSRGFLIDSRVQPFRDVFSSYNLHYYLSIRAPRLGYLVKEVPVSRTYPRHGPTPTKISGLKGKLAVLAELLQAVRGGYDPAA